MEWILNPFKYAGELFHSRSLQFMNSIWSDGTVPECWQKAVTSAHKKGAQNF